MRALVSILLGGALVGAAAPAFGQVPGPGAPPSPPASPPSTAAPGPPAAPATVSAPPPASLPLSPLAPAAPQKVASPAAPKEPEPPRMAGRVGFGIGLWGAPLALITGQNGAGPAAVGASLGVRWWMTERLALLPALYASVQHQETHDTKNDFGEVQKGTSTTSGIVAPSVRVAYAAFSGKTTRLLLAGGGGFSYAVQPNITQHYPDGSPKPPTDDLTKVGFSVLAGLGIEQFFTPRISIALGVDAPIFSFSSTKSGKDDPTTAVGADFNSTQLSAAVFFYTD